MIFTVPLLPFSSSPPVVPWPVVVPLPVVVPRPVVVPVLVDVLEPVDVPVVPVPEPHEIVKLLDLSPAGMFSWACTV
jgi:hypothetical protein